MTGSFTFNTTNGQSGQNKKFDFDFGFDEKLYNTSDWVDTMTRQEVTKGYLDGQGDLHVDVAIDYTVAG